MVLGDGRQIVVRRKHKQAAGLRRMRFGNVRRDTGTQRFTHDIFRKILWECIKGFISRGEETRQARRPAARAITRVFQNINIERHCVVNRPGNVSPIQRGTSVAVDDEHTRGR